MTNKEKLKVLYKLARKIIKKPSSIFLILKDETEFENTLKKKYGIVEFPTIDIDFLFNSEPIEITDYTFLEGGSMITDLVLLKKLAAQFPACNYLEIGSWRGESIVNVADAPNTTCTSINLSPEQIIAMGLPEKYANEHGCLIRGRENIKTIYANSQIFDFSSLDQKFDLIFVDGDHKYDAVKSDTINVFKLLKDENSILIWHDYGYDPVTPRFSVIQAILDGLPAIEHQNLYHVSNTMCALYSKKDLTSYIQRKSDLPSKTFNIKIEIKNICY